MDLNDFTYCEKCGCMFHKNIATYKKTETEWYGTDCKAKCPACKNEIEFNLCDGYYK
jgi:hypothetical protein